MLIVLADLIVDLTLHIAHFPVQAGDLHRLSDIQMGPGGAANVAIAAARLGMQVACLGEMGDDRFGQVVLDGLRTEGVETGGVQITPRARTPVVGVVVGDHSEPAYLGHPGSLTLSQLPEAWRQSIGSAQDVYADGWAETSGVAALVLDGLALARSRGITTYFDPGPGNPDVDNAWHHAAIRHTNVLLVNQAEAEGLTGVADPGAAARRLAAEGADLVIVKLGAAGCLLWGRGREAVVPGFPVEAVDPTGAGDSLAAAVIYGWRRLSLADLGILANASGAVKVTKRGTGHQVPYRHEIEALLHRFGYPPARFFPSSAP